MIYFDNAATSFPKPKTVIEAMENYFFNIGGSTGRSGHRLAMEASELVFMAREHLAELFGAEDSVRIAFMKNITEALNTAINGFLEDGDRVITMAAEHNSVMRPLRYLEQRGKIQVFAVPVDKAGDIDLDVFEDILKKEKIKLVALSHASNVTGILVPIREIAGIAHCYGSTVLVDTAQTAGAYPINVAVDGIDMLAFTGHKSLLGPQGTGGLFVREGIKLEPLMRGGTGSTSERETQPDFMPDQLEAGTLNVIGIAGLGAGVEYILQQGVDKIREKEMELTKIFIEKAEKIKGLKLYGSKNIIKKVAVVSFNISGYTSSEVAYRLDQKFNIACRSGLHCAPSTHKAIGTFPQGTVRFAFGCFNTLDEVFQALDALNIISGGDKK